MPIWQLCANLLIPNCLRSNLSYSPLATLELYVIYPKMLLYTCWVFLVGTVLFSVIQAMQLYEGKSFVIHRLKRIQAMADICFILSGISMVDTVYAFARNWFSNYETYITYFYNKWVLLLLIAALLELYTTHRISRELEKE